MGMQTQKLSDVSVNADVLIMLHCLDFLVHGSLIFVGHQFHVSSALRVLWLVVQIFLLNKVCAHWAPFHRLVAMGLGQHLSPLQVCPCRRALAVFVDFCLCQGLIDEVVP